MLFGIAAMAWPIDTAIALALLWGFWALLDSAGAFAQAVDRDTPSPARVLLIVMGLIALVAAFFAIFSPGVAAVTLTWILGIWLIVRGVFELLGAFNASNATPRGLLLASAAVDVLLGILLESAALDEGRHAEWLDMLTDDFVYAIPVPQSREDPAMSSYGDGLYLAHESKSFRRIASDFAWAERPTGFVRHFESNLRILSADEERGGWSVATNVLVAKSRLGDPVSLSSAQRRDELVLTDAGWRLARRTVLLDTELPTDDHLTVIY
ncbi:DUF308 domain-containing protein [Streptomyces sp. NPDC004227]